jgi:hypothetical protein
MNLDETQRNTVAKWIQEGLKLSEIQTRLNSELGVKLTYMEVRLLVDDLKLVPKDIEPPKPAPALSPAPAPTTSSNPGNSTAAPQPAAAPLKAESAPAPGGVSVTVDQLARPGAIVSGKVIFSDGMRATWYLDQTGRLGLSPEQAGYRPPPGDVEEFQAALEGELSRMGF